LFGFEAFVVCCRHGVAVGVSDATGGVVLGRGALMGVVVASVGEGSIPSASSDI